MKTYRETSDEVFEKIGEYERAKKRRRRAALRVCGVVVAFALVLSLPVAFVLRAFGGKGSAGADGEAGYSFDVDDVLPSDSKNLPGKTLRNPIPCRRETNKIFNV